MATVPRTYHTHQVHYLRKQVAFGALATPTHSVSRHLIGTVPSGAQVISLMAAVKTAFSAAGTRVITAGSNGTTANNFLTTITEETATALMNFLGDTSQPPRGLKDLWMDGPSAPGHEARRPRPRA